MASVERVGRSVLYGLIALSIVGVTLLVVELAAV